MSEPEYLARETCINCPEEVGATEMYENFDPVSTWSFRWQHTGTGKPKCATGGRYAAAPGRWPTPAEVAAWQGSPLGQQAMADMQALAGKLRVPRFPK